MELVDHHCHTVLRDALDREGFESFLTESDQPAPAGCSHFDSQLGAVVRRLCAPLLDLPVGVAPEAYVARRLELGADEVNRRFLRGADAAELFVDSGLGDARMLDLDEIGHLSGCRIREIVRLESVAEDVAARTPAAAEFAAAFATELGERVRGAVAVKSVVAYRGGLGFDPRPPAASEVTAAAGEWLAAGAGRLNHPVLLRHALWTGVETGLPLQLHTGFGDPDEDLRTCDPTLLTDFLRATRSPVMLLHCYPYHRQAAYLAAAFPQVHLDVGLAIPHVGHRAGMVLAETLELAPFHKLLYSSDAYGVAELYFIAATAFRTALGEALAPLGLGVDETGRITDLIAAGNARRVYGPGDAVPP